MVFSAMHAIWQITKSAMSINYQRDTIRHFKQLSKVEKHVHYNI